MPPRLGAVHLSVADLSRSLAYYERGLGLRTHRRENGSVALGGGGGDLLVLHEQPGIGPSTGRNSGLFHYALLVSSRLELARSIRRLADAGLRLTGASDHFVSEAVYLRDPDGHGIEIYRDRPREEWTVHPDGQIDIGTIALDLAGVMGELASPEVPERVDPETVMGHVHLQASELEPAHAFHRDVLGLDTTATLPRQAQFMSWDGYHHHLGMNVWAGSGIPPAPADQAQLLRWSARVDDPAAVAERARAAGAPVRRRDGGVVVRDPSGIAVLLTSAA